MASGLIASAVLVLQLLSHGAATEEKYPNPLLFAKLDGNLRDLTGKNNYPFEHGNTVYTAGPFGEENGAVVMSSGSYVEWLNGKGGPLDFKETYTIMFWLMVQMSSEGSILAYASSSYTNLFEVRIDQTNELSVKNSYGEGNMFYEYTVNAEADDKWVHIAVTYDSMTGYNRLYRNGLEVHRNTRIYGPLRSDGVVFHLGGHSDEGLIGAVSCLQIYDVYMSYNEISKMSGLCRPAYIALNAWPTPIGLWPLNGQFEGKDMKPGLTENGAEIFGSFLNAGPFGSATGSYELVGSESSYIEIDNTDDVTGPLNSFTFSIWIYPTKESEAYPLLQYESGTENTADTWALGFWMKQGYVSFSQGSSSNLAIKSDASIIPYQWNFLVVSLDFSTNEVRFVVNGDQSTGTADSTGGSKLHTRLADRIRIGKSLSTSNTSYANARIACAQMYNVSMSFTEMQRLASKCNDLEEELAGTPSGLVLMFPFNSQSRCNSVVPADQQHLLVLADCNLSKYGPRKRRGEAITLSKSSVGGSFAAFKPRLSESSTRRIENDSSFTLMFYIKLDTVYDIKMMLGFLRPDNSRSTTWIKLNRGGDLQFQAAPILSTGLAIKGLYNQAETEWIHLAISCNRHSSRCYVFRNSSFISESVEDRDTEWFVSTHIFVDPLPASNDNATIELSCLQLYNRALSQGEIIASRDRCFLNVKGTRPPLPAGFWPLDKRYKGRELTGRSRSIEFSNEIQFIDEDPFKSNQGSMYRSGVGKGLIPSNPGSDVRHSVSIQAYIKASGDSTVPYFAYRISKEDDGVRFMIAKPSNSLTYLHTKLVGLNMDTSLQPQYARDNIGNNSWTRVAVTFDYSTGILRHYVDGDLASERRLKAGIELYTTLDVNIGEVEDFQKGVLSMTCLQLYNTVLSQSQLDSAAEYCRYKEQDGSHFRRPFPVEEGHTQSPDNVNSTMTARNKLECLQLCVDNADCHAVNFHQSNKTCELTSLTIEYTGVAAFQNTGGVYLEKVHSLIAEAI